MAEGSDWAFSWFKQSPNQTLEKQTLVSRDEKQTQINVRSHKRFSLSTISPKNSLRFWSHFHFFFAGSHQFFTPFWNFTVDFPTHFLAEHFCDKS